MGQSSLTMVAHRCDLVRRIQSRLSGPQSLKDLIDIRSTDHQPQAL